MNPVIVDGHKMKVKPTPSQPVAEEARWEPEIEATAASSRPRRNSKPPPITIKPSVRVGLESITETKYAVFALQQMLEARNIPGATLVEKLIAVMGSSNYTPEMLLANYFDQKLLAAYCEQRLGKSGKGSAGTLASRIAREWEKPDFKPYAIGEAPPPPENLGGQKTKRQKTEESGEGAAASSSSAPVEPAAAATTTEAAPAAVEEVAPVAPEPEAPPAS